MKKALCMILTAFFIFSLISCGSTPAETSVETSVETAETITEVTTVATIETIATEATTTATEATTALTTESTTKSTEIVEPESEYISGVETLDKYISYNEIVKNANTVRYDTFSDPNPFKEAYNYVYQPKNEASLLTEQEISLLQNVSRPQKGTITYDEAVADVDLYFRAFKYAFGPYNYMGGDDFFDELHEKILEELNQYKGKNIRTSVLKDIMDKHMAAVQDAHMNGGNKYFTNQYRYTYFYCTDQYYALDEGGFYKLIDGEKWYYVCCDNDVVEMKPTMTQDGKIAYSLVRFCPIADENGKTLPNKNEIVLRNEKTEKKQIVTWIKNKTYGYVNGTDYNFIQENGITYISQRGFIFSGNEYSQALNEYVQAGKKARNSNVIIFDFRSHKGGGSDEMYSSFARGITGKNIEFRQFHAVRRNALSQQYSTLLGKEQFEVIKNDSGHVTKNDIPIIILVDEDCGSGGDEVFCVTRTLENVIVIGSNNGGLYINDVQQYNLPNSGISFNMGGRFWPHYSMENLDGIGNEPDIWCNPADALDIALKMIVNEGLATKAETDGLLKKMPIEFSNDITLKIGNYSIKAGGGFGGIGNIGYVYFKDKIVTDFTVTVLDDTCGNVINDNGKIKIIPKAEGECTFNVYYKNVYATFKCRIH